MKQLLALIFLIVFSFQVLPVKKLGELLAKGQTEEEVKADCSDDAGTKAVKYDDLVAWYSSQVFSFRSKSISTDRFTILRPDDMPVSYVVEILSPPPNC